MTDVLTADSALLGPATADGTERIDRLVARWAAARPTAPAVRWRGEVTTYADLLQEADRVAAALTAAGVRPLDVVAVRVPRSPQLVSCLLGILRLGAVYTAVPVDWPVNRAEEAARRTGAVLCVTDAVHPFAPGPLPVADLADLTAGRAPGAGVDPGSRQAAPAAPAGSCCVFFTSGSTGTPKSVLAPHSGVIRVARDPRLGFDDRTCMLQTAPTAWDAFAMEVWCPLVSGGSTLLNDSQYFLSEDVGRAVAAGVDTVFLTSTLFNATVDDAPEVFAGLRLLMVGGERVSPRHMAAAHRRHPDTRLFNVYGPVECTVYATVQQITAAAAADAEVPVGTPIADTGIHVLDADLRPLPAGGTGEIALSGLGLAAGYLGDEEATGEAFRTLPLGPGGADLRVYLTGDLGRLNAAGELECVGRKDRQVKIRGVRVDVNEVERFIVGRPGVGVAAVLPLPYDSPNKDGLAAFCTVRSDPAPTGDGIRAALAEAFPSAFVPSRVTVVAELPKLANGKVDLRALAGQAEQAAELALAAAGRDGADDGEEPVSEAVRTLVDIAGELLKCPVSAGTDVFALGATSITAIQLANRLGRARGRKVPVAYVLVNRTPAAIVAALEADGE